MLSVVTCPACGKVLQLDQSATIKTNVVAMGASSGSSGRKVELVDIRVNDIGDCCGKVRQVLAGVRPALHDGVMIDSLVELLRMEYGLARSYALAVIERIKDFYEMYSPDNRRLYFIQTQFAGRLP